ncbi:MAG: ferric reductase-like transmembrane domain-containing protein [Anaerolineae bacterium]|nr:ferric reductase-like transmembrane domain-containing protein [Anaerolineae bacterium]
MTINMPTQPRATVNTQRLAISRAFWIAVYVLMIVSPLIILVLGGRPIEREPLRELSVILAFVGFSLMGLQFVPTARLPMFSNLFDMDTLYALHHRLSIAAFVAVLAHPILLFVNNPFTLRLLNVFTAPWRARAAVAATLFLIVLVVTSVWRKQLEIHYEAWHWVHDILSMLIAGFALYHIFKINYYTAVPAQRILWIVLAVLWAMMIGYTRLVRPWMLLRRPYEVTEVKEEYGEAWTLTVKPVGHRGLIFRPGQFAWLVAWKSPFAISYHPFSFSSSAVQPERLQFTIKELGDWTNTVKEMAVGKTIYVDGPYGVFGPDMHDAPGYVFIAGGSGVAPFMSMLRTFADRGDQRPVQFYYGNWKWDTIICRDELAALEERLNLELVHVLEEPPEGWEGEVGYVTPQLLDRRLPRARADYEYFLCGPLIMIDKVEEALEGLGVSKRRIHSEKYEMA